MGGKTQVEDACAGRRNFVAKAFTYLGLGSLATSFVGSAYANLRFFFPNVLYEPPSEFRAGFPDDYQLDTVSGRWFDEHQVWIIRKGDKLYALLGVCTHLGCLVDYFSREELYKCPCHGSNFSPEGDPVAGPAPVPLYRVALSLGEDGQVVVDKAQRENRTGKREKPPFVLKI